MGRRKRSRKNGMEEEEGAVRGRRTRIGKKQEGEEAGGGMRRRAKVKEREKEEGEGEEKHHDHHHHHTSAESNHSLPIHFEMDLMPLQNPDATSKKAYSDMSIGWERISLILLLCM